MPFSTELQHRKLKLSPTHCIALEMVTYEVVEDKPVIVQILATDMFILGRR